MNKTIEKIREELDEKRYSAEELVKEYLKIIREKDGDIHAFLEVFEDDAITQARLADKKIKKGEASLLTGIPCAIKDNILIKGKRCTSASKILENYIAPYNATVIDKLEKEGVIFLGKTNMDEFAMGSSTETSYFGPTKNPNDLNCVPGGSSGGSAAAVSAGMAAFALGSDTGGSIRQPASFCGTIGLKPTYGRVSRNGLMAYASSLDQIGVFANTIKDVSIIFEAIKGRDAMDSTTVDAKEKGIICNREKIRIGVPKEYFSKGLDGEVEKAVREAIKEYEKNGVQIIDIDLPHSQYALACYYIIAPAEASANLARFDGIRYGFESEADTMEEIYINTRTKGFGDEVKRRIMLGTYTLSSGYYDAYYKKALKTRTLVKKDFEEAFTKVDAILGPVSPVLPFKIGEKFNDPLSMYLADIYTVSVNLAGLPAMSVPIAKSKSGLPIGLHLITSHFEENKLFSIAEIIKK